MTSPFQPLDDVEDQLVQQALNDLGEARGFIITRDYEAAIQNAARGTNTLRKALRKRRNLTSYEPWDGYPGDPSKR